MARPLTHPEIQQLLLHLIDDAAADVAGVAARTLKLSRQAVNKHLRELVRSGVVVATGSTRSRKYELVQVEEQKTFPLEGLAEHDVWDEFVRPYLSDLPDNVRAICQYGLTEMVNNAIDHSGGTVTRIILILNPVKVQINVYDDGVGIFNKIKDAFHLERESDVILELSKGKLTTDPSRHSGEGIFFTSRVFDEYSIYSGTLFFLHMPDNDDWLLERGEVVVGTLVTMQLNPASTRTTTEVFDKFAGPDQYRFDVTHVPVKLAQLGEDSLVSRSQAKRLVSRFEKFSRVVLNFAGVATIGQAFADEVFRVFRNSHPDVELTWINTSDEVKRMISRALASAEPPE
jgi:anti-sigma regulatory factor (Ser/Thr protein kinase)/biotin operon repressor